jgi:hypothetical protein
MALKTVPIITMTLGLVGDINIANIDLEKVNLKGFLI